MAGNRKAFEAQVLSDLKRIDPTGRTSTYYKEAFAKMNDNDIDNFVKSLEDGTESLVVYRPLGEDPKITRDEKMDLAIEWDLALFERLWIDDGINTPYLTPNKYLILQLPVRRQAQMLDEKISVPESDTVIDELTGQATGESKSSAVSNPEVQVLLGYDLEYTLTELLKLRGGDTRAYSAMTKSIDATGGVSVDQVSELGTQAESTYTLRSYLLGMHLSNNL